MPEFKDPAIKLFGKTIQLSHIDDIVVSEANEQKQYCSGDIKKTMEHEHLDDTDSGQSTYSNLRINDDPKTPTPDKETTSKKEENPNPDEKPQKPDKILPCPRCNSMDTKFCYYNNYNVNQPRYYCKNCQRYWTAGGTMRNTPVGSGRRKNKSLCSSSYYRQLIVTDNFLRNNGSVLNFGSVDDSSSSASNLVENGVNNNACPVQLPCFPASQLCHPWSYAQYQPHTNLYYSGFPVNIYPMPMPMQMQLMNPNSPLGKHSRDGDLVSWSSNCVNKEPLKDKDSENSRVNDPNKSAKSSLWSSLGISKEENGSDSINGAILSKAFNSKNDEKNEVGGSSLASLQANPAALSRSLNFRETT